MSRILLDTHVLLWALFRPARLSRRVRDLLDNTDTRILVSTASAWEIATKCRLGRLAEAGALVQDYAGSLRTFLAEEVPINSAHALTAGGFPIAHRDPFDRILASQSMLEGAPLVTDDRAFRHFPITTLW